MAFRVLCTGDVHIGRRVSKVTESYRCADAWSAVIDLAVAEAVDLLAVSGDIVEKESRSYEALGPLEAGLQRLERAGIPAVAVSGNHDHDVLANLAGITGGGHLRVLGRGGRWERATFTGADSARLHVDGWSFPSEHVPDDPLTGYRPPPADGTPVLGLLHGEVGVPGSRYAPIRLDDLWARPVDLWLLGHIHLPHQYTAPHGVTAFYPGSPWAMDPGEPGVHGAWLAEFAAGQPVGLDQRPLAPVAFHRDEVDLTHITDQTDFQNALMTALRVRGEEAVRQGGEALRFVSCRLHLAGQTPLHHQVRNWANLAQADLTFTVADRVTVQLDTITLGVRPAIDLAQFARGNDPAGEAARLILALDAPAGELDPAYAALVRDARESVAAVDRHAAYQALAAPGDLASDGPSEPAVRALLREQAWRLLSELIGEKTPA